MEFGDLGLGLKFNFAIIGGGDWYALHFGTLYLHPLIYSKTLYLHILNRNSNTMEITTFRLYFTEVNSLKITIDGFAKLFKNISGDISRH